MLSRIIPSSANPHCKWHRIESRARVAMEAVLDSVHGRQRGFILNLSCHGAMAQMPDPPGRRTFVMLKCGPLEVLGMVAWVDRDGFGVQFDEPIEEDLVIELRRMADQAVRDIPSQGRPGLRARPLTAAETKAAEDWAVSGNFR